MSATRPPAHSREHGQKPGEPEVLDELNDLEELGDEAIISQQTAAHALQPRANVSEESRSVVITEHAERRASERPRNPPKSSAEATLVIRDRRALDEMRQKIVRRQQQKKAEGRKSLYLWGALGLAAFVLGGIVAFLATDTRPESRTGDALRSTPAVQPGANSSVQSPPPAVRLENLPVEAPSKP